VPHDDSEATDEFAQTYITELIRELQAARLSLPISQRRLSAQLGLTEFVVRRWETRVDSPFTGNFVRWAHALGYRVNILTPERDSDAERPEPHESESFELDEFTRIAAALRRSRIDAGLTQKALGDALSISGWTMSMWELAQRQPRILHLIKWADALGCRLVLTKL
jgi:transcriptional regulator with XRE-family HTH domain